jgi:hypothetical protein
VLLELIKLIGALLEIVSFLEFNQLTTYALTTGDCSVKIMTKNWGKNLTIVIIHVFRSLKSWKLHFI